MMIKKICYYYFFVSALLIIFVVAQRFYEPALDPGYTRIFRAPGIYQWDDNGFFALAGLDAPAGVADTYSYGRAKIADRAREFAALQKAAGWENVAVIPAFTAQGYAASVIPDSPVKSYKAAAQELKWNATPVKGDALGCQYQLKQQLQASSSCASKNDIAALIANNKILWDRYGQLSRYKNMVAIPKGLKNVYSAEVLINLSRLKAASIIDRADSGDVAGAFQEWRDYMLWSRTLVKQPGTMVEKAIYMIVLGFFTNSYETLLYRHPEIAVHYASDIETALRPEGLDLFNARMMMTDDERMHEPYVFQFAQPGNAILNAIYECDQNYEQLSKLAASRFPKKRQNPCSYIFPWNNTLDLIKAVSMPGQITSNYNYIQLQAGMLKGVALLSNMHAADAKMRMVLVATHIIQNTIPKTDIEHYLKTQPENLDDPFTQEPFSWDASANRIFFKFHGGDGTAAEKSFYLPYAP